MSFAGADLYMLHYWQWSLRIAKTVYNHKPSTRQEQRRNKDDVSYHIPLVMIKRL
jgi:hypothetical protein